MRSRQYAIAGAAILLVGALAWAVWGRAGAANPASGGGHKQIIVSINGNANRVAGLKALIRAYNQIHPDVQVRIELKGAGITTQYETWLTTQLASGDPRPDIVSSPYSPNYDRYVDLDYYRKVVNPYTGRPWDEDVDFDWYNFRNQRGQRTMHSVNSVHIMWFYNKDVFDKLGLVPPRTWPELIGICQKLKDAGYGPTSLIFDFRFYQWLTECLWDQFSRNVINLARAQPGDWCYNAAVDGTWHYDPSDPFNDRIPTINDARIWRAIRDRKIRYDTPEFAQFLKNLKAIYRYGAPDFWNERGGNVPYDTFVKQQAIIHLDGSWAIPQLYADMDELVKKGKAFHWATFEMPPQTDPGTSPTIRTVESAVGPYISVINKNEPQTDLVMDFVMFWYSPQGYQIYVDGQVAANEFQPTGQIMIRGVKMPPRFAKMFENVKMIGNAEYLQRVPSEFPPKTSVLRQDALQILGAYLRDDNASAEQTAAKLDAIMMPAVKLVMSSYNLTERYIDHPELDPSK